MQIWIHLNGIQQGPYTLPQLQMMNLDPSTPVWYEGLVQWMAAAEAPVTSGLFGVAHSELTGQNQSQELQNIQQKFSKPKTYLVWNIIFTILCCCPLSLAGIITGAITQSRYGAGDHEGAKRMSTVTEWLFILSIVWIVLSMPVAIAWNLFNV